MKDRITLILGGQRSGKSAYAEKRALEPSGKAAYLATAEAFDDEMRARIDAHRARRGEAWACVEEPLALAARVAGLTAPDRPLLIECLGTWMGNLMHHGGDVESESRSLVETLDAARGPVILVSSEVGLGVVPDNHAARRFADHLGALNQRLAARADHVVLVAAGLPVVLKG